MSQKNDTCFCPNCGERNDGVVNFCYVCGALLKDKDGEYLYVENGIGKKGGSEESDSLNDMSVTDDANGSFEALDASVKSGETNGCLDNTQSAEEDEVDLSHSDEGAEPSLQAEPFDIRKWTGTGFAQVRSSYKNDAAAVSLNRGDRKASVLKKHAVAMFIVALTLFIALFIPTVNVGTEYNEYARYYVSYSPMEFVTTYMDAMDDYYAPSLIGTDTYRDYIDMKEHISRFSSYEYLSNSQINLLSDYAKSAIKYDVSYNGTPPKISFLFALVVIPLYAVVAIVSVLIAAIAAMVVYNSTNYDSIYKALKVARKTCMFLISCALLSVLLLMRAAHFRFGGTIENFADLGVGLSFGGVLILAICFGVFLQVACICIFDRKNSGADKKYSVRMKGIALITILIMGISLFMPSLVIKCAAPSTRGAYYKTYNVNPCDIYGMDENDIDYYMDQVNSTTQDEYVDLAVSIADNSKNKSSALSVFHLSAFFNGNVSDIYVIFEAVHILLLMFIVSLLKRMSDAVLGFKPDKKPKGRIFFVSILSFAYLIINVVISVICYNNLSYNMAFYTNFSIGIGPIISAVCVVLSIVALAVRKAPKRELEYDNPDVFETNYIK